MGKKNEKDQQAWIGGAGTLHRKSMIASFLDSKHCPIWTWLLPTVCIDRAGQESGGCAFSTPEHTEENVNLQVPILQ
jgi:hypothetical protein